jgi:hypothetical protein
MATKYYSDEEIIELVETVGDSCNSYFWVANLVRERLEQKDKQIAFQASRLRTAAEHIGFNMIDELQSYE